MATFTPLGSLADALAREAEGKLEKSRKVSYRGVEYRVQDAAHAVEAKTHNAYKSRY